MNKELVEWQLIPNSDGAYMCSNYGELLCLGYKYKDKNGKIYFKKPFVVKSWEDLDGYLNYDLTIKGVKHRWKAHRLVGYLFVNGYSEKLDINHDDLNKKNNYYKNLIPATKKQNTEHAAKNGLYNKNFNHLIGKSWRQKNITQQYDLSGNFLKEWDSLALAAKELSFNKRMISRAIVGRSKTAFGYKWAYKK